MSPYEQREVEMLVEQSELLRELLNEMTDNAYTGCAFGFFAMITVAAWIWQGKTEPWQYGAAGTVIIAAISHYISSRVHFARIAKRRNALNARIKALDPDQLLISEKSRWGWN